MGGRIDSNELTPGWNLKRSIGALKRNALTMSAELDLRLVGIHTGQLEHFCCRSRAWIGTFGDVRDHFVPLREGRGNASCL